MPFKDKDRYQSAEYKEYQRNYQREWHQRHKAERLAKIYERRDAKRAAINQHIQEIKKQNCCADCGQQHLATLHFHHLNSEDKLFNIGHASDKGFSLDKIDNEIKKCVILCANCHAIRHYNERNQQQSDIGTTEEFEVFNPLQVMSSEHECFGNHSYLK